MRLIELGPDEVARRLCGPGLILQTGPLNLRVRSDVAAVIDALSYLYADYLVLEADTFCDASIEVVHAKGLRRWVRPQVHFRHDKAPVFEPMPADQATALVEWALNWAIGAHAHQFLILHAAAIERNGHAAVLPAPPGSGKSTLCAALIHRGWRLLSDELTLLSLADGNLFGPVRPVSLKNQSLDLIAAFAPEARFGSRTLGTAKGTLAHLRVARSHIDRAQEPASPGWIVFPRFVADAPASLAEMPKAQTVLRLSRNAFNSGVTGREGFIALSDLVTCSGCYEFSYGQLDDAVNVFDRLANTLSP